MENKHISEISFMNEELLRRDEDLDVMSKENQKLREMLVAWEQSNVDLINQNEEKLDRVQAEYKNRIKLVKQEVEELTYSNGTI